MTTCLTLRRTNKQYRYLVSKWITRSTTALHESLKPQRIGKTKPISTYSTKQSFPRRIVHPFSGLHTKANSAYGFRVRADPRSISRSIYTCDCSTERCYYGHAGLADGRPDARAARAARDTFGFRENDLCIGQVCCARGKLHYSFRYRDALRGSANSCVIATRMRALPELLR